MLKNVMKRKVTAPSNLGKPPRKKITQWQYGLLDSMKDPKCIFREDDTIVVITDKYPKSRFHYLIIPKEDIPQIRNIQKKHVHLLEHMEEVGIELSKLHPDYEFKIGYHVNPSMYRLHLHVISTDFDSPCLKTKYHWNSFTTPFFVNSADILNQLKEHGEVKLIESEEYQKYLSKDLQCHKCSFRPQNMPALKKHILQHVNK